ncbi:MAG: hypothetical protein A2406_00660 [Candidatus Komeilibacteria bacterium RIFOXYC1_FULL_37_11]|uniref:Uncharacterized protein n=1 Tax=Candidatus Komeilibacteria bacterium RIFOXYC1_FULL_37_11 TaxID=1798555 RepID=A0A1G2BZ70_9BACT|nr:MAG: hypothetical protein A2406_00660 [Candidatus Komeilibacteria bacterium RIFOXYC1_FULL_37_11]OGY95999.1 MAG: hypothetical protein A2611_04275 [Candidatus Komeilibacteria bacterium RIFOXYD1_FULL_37_29]
MFLFCSQKRFDQSFYIIVDEKKFVQSCPPTGGFWAIVSPIAICYDTFMSKIFKKSFVKNSNLSQRPVPSVKEDIMDPILYSGGLDKEKYPQLPLENETKVEEDVENPLNQRRTL